MRVPSVRAINQTLIEELGREVVSAEVLDIEPGQHVTITPLSASSPFRQGLWVATEGAFAIQGSRAAQLELWFTPGPLRPVAFDVVETDGFLRFYNVWDSGRGIKPYEELGVNSGMIRCDLPDGSIEYRCNDTGKQREFDRLVFAVRIE